MADIKEYSVSIEYKTKGAKEAQNEADKVGKGIKKIKSSTSGMSKITTALGTIGKGMGIATKTIAGMTVAGVTMAVKMGKNMANLSKQTSDYIEKVNLFRTSMGSLAREAEDFVNMGETKLGLDPAAMMDAISSFQNLSEGFGITSDRAYIMSKNLTQLSGDLSSFANISFEAAQKKLMSGFSGQVLPLRQYGIALDQASLQELAYSLGIEQRVKTMTRAQKTELIYYQIMKSTEKMQHDLGRTLMSPANALRVLQNEFKALARAVGSIFIPIIQKIIPIMRAVTKALTSAARAIAEFFGFKVSDYTVDFAEVGDSIGGIEDDIDGVGGAAEGAAKKMQKMLMPFDELNNINSPDTSSSGGGGGYGAGGSGGSLGIELPQYDMFEIINDKVMKFGDVLGKAKEAAHKLNEGLASIDWDSIKEGARIAGESVAKFFNVGIEEIDWKLMGKTLAEGFNTAIETMYGFVTTLNWSELGFDIADLVTGFFDNVDWAKTGQTISTFVEGVFDTVYKAFANIDFMKLAVYFETFVENINWNKIADNIFSALGAALGGISAFLGKLIADGIEDTYEWFEESVEKCGGNIMLGIYVGIQTAMAKIGDWIMEHILEPFLSAFMDAFGIHSPSKVMAEQGEYIMEGLLNGIESLIDKIGETWEKIKTTITDKIEEIKEKGKEIFEKLWLAILEGSQNAVNKCIDGFNIIIGGINELGQYFGLHLDEIQHVTWADEYKAEMDKMSEKTNETGENAVDTMDKTMAEMSKNIQPPLSTIDTNFATTFARIKESTSGNLGQAEIITKTKTDYIKSLITGNFGNARENAQKSTQAIQKETEGNLGKISSSSVFSRIKSSIETALNNSQTAKRLGIETSSNFEQGLQSNIGSQNVINSVTSKISSIFKSNNSYSWGQDMVQGFIRGINSVKGTLTNAVSGIANIVRSFWHFSRPDEGPLRDYETWMPDMIKGLSKTLIDASPILDNAVGTISSKIANSLSDITMPEEKDFAYEGNYTSTVIGNIGNRMNNANKDETTTNMIRATYDAVSRALSDTRGTQDNRPIIVNVGNRRLYEGYGQYQDEQSNMLGVNI